MGFEKFDQHNKGAYWERYFEKDRKFYDTIKNHIAAALSMGKSAGMDIGAGPGVGAKLLDDLNIKTIIYGYEPSETSADGTVFAEELRLKNSTVEYRPIHCGMEKIQTPENDSLDYILALRTAHEIAESMNSRDKFFNELCRLLGGLKKQGSIIIAEPQFSDSFASQPEMLKLIQAYKQEKIGHSHVPSDYITDIEMKKHMEEAGLNLINENIIPDEKLLDYLVEQGFILKESPCYFYVQTFRKE